MSGSGFENIAFESSMMKSGCVKGVLSRSDCNHAWIVHNVTFKALERLLVTCFLTAGSGINMFTARMAISRHISPMIKGTESLFQLVINRFCNQKPKY